VKPVLLADQKPAEEGPLPLHTLFGTGASGRIGGEFIEKTIF